ncbi:MAG TPA: proteasome accessory factor PafA2 family protein [Candidatus Saccharimonadales bacterium]|nr:proteasome accessory factor PafA2 family protein [Candidatus Saccharimonadales bacterium]
MSRVRPDDFFSAHPPSRIIGVECEYNVQGTDVSMGDLLAEETLNEFSTSGDESEFAWLWTDDKLQLPNGGNLHADVGHLEYNTPESRGPREAATADLAGTLIVAELAEICDHTHRGVYRRTGTDLNARVSYGGDHEEEDETVPAHGSATSGYHENYLIPACIAESLLDSPLLPSYLATRWWSFAGIVGRGGYELSQKAQGIGLSALDSDRNGRRTDESAKPMALVMGGHEDLDVNATREWSRVEVRYADAGQSRWSRLVSLAMTSAVLRLHEYRDILSIDDKYLLEQPVQAAHQISQDLPFKRVYETIGGSASAANIAEELAQNILALGKEIDLPKDELWAAREVIRATESLKRTHPQKADYGDLIDRVDFAAKHHVMRNIKNIRPAGNSKQALAFDLQWDRIYPKGVAQVWWQRQAYQQQVISDEAIYRSVAKPPRYTRAAIRGRAVADGVAQDADWTYVHFGEGKGILLNNPYDSRLPADYPEVTRA